jgi:hypothetical protein
MDFSLQTPRRGFGSLGAEEDGVKNEGEGWAIYRENLPLTP